MKSLIPCLLILLLGCSGNKINNTFERGSVNDDPQSVILGLDVLLDEKINNKEAIANPEALKFFEDLPQLKL